MSKRRDFVIFTADGARYIVSAPTLRTALRNSTELGKNVEIVAAMDAGCLPVEPAEPRPFVAVFLANPNFVKPEWPQ